LRADPVSKQKVVDKYTSQIGVHELTGHNDGVEVEAYLKTTNFTKGAPWCAAFLSWTFIQCDVPALKTAWAPAWFPPTHTIYTRGNPKNLKPDRADVFGIYFQDQGHIGHVGFIDQWPDNDDYVITVEGNTNLAGSAEGDGVYRKRRLKMNVYKVSRWT